MTQADANHGHVRGRWSLVSAFAVVFLPAFVAIATWSLAMPRDSGPDEPSHVVHAAAVDRGQWVGAPIKGHLPGFTLVHVPAAFSYLAGVGQEHCFQSPPTRPASCQPPWLASGGSVATGTYTGRYPPLYYAVVGLPTLVSSSLPAFYAMRLLSALASALFLGLAGAVAAVWSRNRMLRVGILLAVTPMALYSAAFVNPSGLEICAALCLWVSGMVLVREHLDDPPAGLVVIVAVSAAVLALSRPISPLWLGIIGATLLAVCDARAAIALLRRSRLVQVALGSVALATALAVAWVLAVHSFDVQRGLVGLPAHASALDVLRASVLREGTWLQETVGIFGSHETVAPLVTYVVWGAGITSLGVVSMLVGRRRDLTALVGLVVACVVLPVAIQFLHARSLGIVWQGRYTLPAAVGIPILGAVIVGSAALPTRLRHTFELGVVLAVTVGAFLAFAEALRRYAVGIDGPILFFRPKWQPVGGVAPWLVSNLAATSLLAGALWWTRRRPASVSGIREGSGTTSDLGDQESTSVE